MRVALLGEDGYTHDTDVNPRENCMAPNIACIVWTVLSTTVHVQRSRLHRTIQTLQEGPEAVAAMLTYVDVYGNPAEATLPTTATKLATLLGAVSNINDEHTAPTFAYTPRVRREWRTLSTAMRRKVAAAYWVMRTVNSSTGRELYGPNFINYDEFVLKHTCVANDPKCDQGHFGPHFVTTHRTFVLWAERSLLAIDPTIGAAPYWDATKDAVASNPEVADGEYRDEPMLYI